MADAIRVAKDKGYTMGNSLRAIIVIGSTIALIAGIVFGYNPAQTYVFHHTKNMSPRYFRYSNLIESPVLEGSATSVPILLYHGVVAEQDGVNTSQASFVDQMEWLKRSGFQTISAKEYLQFRRGRFTLPARPVIITFDDGRKDSYYPTDEVLQALGFKATICVVTARMDEEPNFYLTWNELAKMRDCGRWEIEAHGHHSHDKISGNGLYLSSRLPNEDDAAFTQRLADDHDTCIRLLKEHLGIDAHFYAIPFTDYGASGSINPDPSAFLINERVVEQRFDLAFGHYGELPINTATSNGYRLSRIEALDTPGEELVKIMVATNGF